MRANSVAVPKFQQLHKQRPRINRVYILLQFHDAVYYTRQFRSFSVFGLVYSGRRTETKSRTDLNPHYVPRLLAPLYGIPYLLLADSEE